MQDYKCRVLSIEDFVDSGKTVYKIIKLEKPEGFSFKAGQFAFLASYALRKPETQDLLWRPFTIASSPLQDFLEFALLIKYSGGLTQHIHESIKEGDFLLVKGPVGVFGLGSEKKVVFVATGCGITPFISMLRTVFAEKKELQLQLFYGFRNANQFLYKEELEKMAENENFEFFAAASNDPDWPGFKGYVNPLLTEHALNGKDVHFYLCGSPVAMESVTKHLIGLGVSFERIHKEKW